MKYWIIVDDRHAGPFSAQQLLESGLNADTLVWFEGLPDWVAAATVPELAEGLRMQAAEAEARFRAQQEAAMHAQQNFQQPCECEPEPVQPEPEPVQAPCDTMQQPMQQPQPQAQTRTLPDEPCPPAYIAWSIIATLLCCTIVGIPAIIFASMTRSAYYKGDLAKAKRYSELAQWFIIASIVLGAVSWPFQMAIMGMFQ